MSEAIQAAISALKAAIKVCPLCHGRGEWQTHCYRCEDSTDDHICSTVWHKCSTCEPWRVAVLDAEKELAGPPPHAASEKNHLTEAGKRGEQLCPICHEPDHESPCL